MQDKLFCLRCRIKFCMTIYIAHAFVNEACSISPLSSLLGVNRIRLLVMSVAAQPRVLSLPQVRINFSSAKTDKTRIKNSSAPETSELDFESALQVHRELAHERGQDRLHVGDVQRTRIGNVLRQVSNRQLFHVCGRRVKLRLRVVKGIHSLYYSVFHIYCPCGSLRLPPLFQGVLTYATPCKKTLSLGSPSLTAGIFP